MLLMFRTIYMRFIPCDPALKLGACTLYFTPFACSLAAHSALREFGADRIGSSSAETAPLKRAARMNGAEQIAMRLVIL